MPTAIVYPASLPCPQTAPIQSAERRRVSPRGQRADHFGRPARSPRHAAGHVHLQLRARPRSSGSGGRTRSPTGGLVRRGLDAAAGPDHRRAALHRHPEVDRVPADLRLEGQRGVRGARARRAPQPFRGASTSTGTSASTIAATATATAGPGPGRRAAAAHGRRERLDDRHRRVRPHLHAAAHQRRHLEHHHFGASDRRRLAIPAQLRRSRLLQQRPAGGQPLGRLRGAWRLHFRVQAYPGRLPRAQ
jgi:hypothetical protein